MKSKGTDDLCINSTMLNGVRIREKKTKQSGVDWRDYKIRYDKDPHYLLLDYLKTFGGQGKDNHL